MEAVVEYMRKNSLKAVASCAYANSWLRKNSAACADVVADGNGEMPAACRIDGQH
jgi:predicted GNAT family acetyltransferase